MRAALTLALSTGGVSTLLHPDRLLESLGAFAVVGIIAIVFAETGLLVGFFLPGDSLLFLAGFYCTSTPGNPVHLDLAVLLPGVAVAAVAGAQTGYLIGRYAGQHLFNRPDSRLFKRSHVERTREVLERYGEVKAVVLARFIPIVRTFMNPAVGMAEMPQRRFLLANLGGGLLWSVGVTLLGYGLGKSLGGTGIDRYVLPVTLLIVVVSLVPVVKELRSARR